jgi:multidrug resistance protein
MKKGALGALFLTVFVDLLGFAIVVPLLPRYAEDYRASNAAIGLLMASFSAMQFLFAPVWGRVSDRVGRRPVIMVGLFGSILSYVLFGFADSMVLLFASRVAAGVFGATIGTAQAYIADVTPAEERGKGMALIGAAFGLGFAFGPALGGLAHEHLGARAPGLVAAGFSTVAFLLAWRSLPEPARRTAARHGWFPSLGAALSTPRVPPILCVSILSTFAFAAFESTLSRFTKARWGYDPGENGWIFTYVGFCLLLAQGFLVRRYMKRVGELAFTVAGTATLAVGLVLVGLAPGTGAALGALPVVVLGFSMVTPSLASLLSRATAAERQGEILGVYQSGLALARIAGPFAGNLLFRRSPEAPFWFGAAVMAVAFLGTAALRRANG